MGNIVGEPFKDYVKNQINLRQEVHGKKDRTDKDLIYLNSRTSWIKLASGTFLEQDRLDLIPELKNKPEFLGMGLARNFTLFNGTTPLNKNVDQQKVDEYITNLQKFNTYKRFSKTEILESDLGQNTILPSSTTYSWGASKAGILGNSPNPAYGMTGNTDFGIVPMPGIESVNVRTLERGSIKRATIKIKAHNKLQFDIIDILYLRLGYAIFLEWGDSHYLDNNNKSNPVTPLKTSIIERVFFKNNFSPTYYDCLDILEEEREKYSGCYDGILGKISNFKWTFNPDGSYDITLEVISLGDVVESLKLNVAPFSIPAKSIDPEAEEEDEAIPLIDSKRESNELAKVFYDIKTNALLDSKGKGFLEEVNDVLNAENPNTNGPVYLATYENSFNGKATRPTLNYSAIGRTIVMPKIYHYLFNPNEEDMSSPDRVLEFDKTFTSRFDYEVVQTSYLETKYQWYIRFGALLSFINKLLIQDLKNNDGTSYPSLKIDTNPETNLMYYIPNMVSLDPRICIISNYQVKKPNNIMDTIFGGLQMFERNYPATNTTYGNIMNIYININHVLELFGEADKDGNIIFMDFLRKLCNNVSNSLGKVNKLEPKIDPETNIIKIFDQTPLPNKENLPSNIYPTGSGIKAPFNLYGYNVKNDTSNFIHNVGLTTEITPEYATMITVGATADGYVVGSEATAFSKWNIGIIDRFKEAISLNNTPQDDKLIKKYETIQENYYKRLSLTSEEDDGINWYSYAGIVGVTFWDGISEALDMMFTWDMLFTTPITAPRAALNLFKQQKDRNIGFNGTTAVYLSPESISTNLEVIPEYYKLLQAQTVQEAHDKNKSSGQGFLPFNLKLEMDGLSGMKIYQKIEVDSTFLPTNYPEKLEFITTNVNHELKNNKWTTKIDSIATVKNLINTNDILGSIDLNLNEIGQRGMKRGTIKTNNSTFIRITDSPTIIKNPKTNPNPIIIEDEKQKKKYLKLYKNQLGEDFDNFVIRKGSDPNSYVMKINSQIQSRAQKFDKKIFIKGNGNYSKPGELGNGGDISKGLYNTLLKLLDISNDDKYDDLFDVISNLTITAGNDHFHQGKTVLKNPSSYPKPSTSPVNPSNTTHTRGLAIDVRVNAGWVSQSQNEINLMIELLQDAGFTGILYHDPPHIHANIDPSIDHSK